MPRRSPEVERVSIAGISISHPDRVIYGDTGITKLDIARYYDELSAAMLPHVAGRPLTLLRCGGTIDLGADKGGCVMLRHGKAWGPHAIRRVRIRELRKTGEYLVADNRAAVVGLAQMGVVEIHTWNARAETPYEHDRIVIDLDPGPALRWGDVTDAAKLVRQLLAAVGLQSWVKTTGGKGLHVVVPIEPTGVEICLAFARGIAATLVNHDPSRFTTANPKAGRERQILIDTLRNNRTNTSVAAYSLRARPGAPVSVPIAWDDLDARLDPARFTLASVRQQVKRGQAKRFDDAWADYWSVRQRLPLGVKAGRGAGEELRD